MLIAQITDTHIRRNGDERRYLTEAIGWLGALAPRPDVVLLTGDAADSGDHEQYLLLREILARCPVPVYVVPGNHDRVAALRAVLPPAYFPGAPGPRMHYVVDAFAVRLIGLDTAVYRWPGGVLDAPSLAWLDGVLAGERERPTLIFMHHPPFRTGVNAADAFGFRGLRALRAIVERRPAVRRLIAGHIHCDRRATLGAALASTTASTAPQNVPEVFERRLIALRPQAPGFAIHHWANGAFTTTTFVNDGRGHFTGHPDDPHRGDFPP